MNGMNGMNGYGHRDQNSYDAGMPQSLRPVQNLSRPGTRSGSYGSHDSFHSYGNPNAQFGSVCSPERASSFPEDPVC